MRIVARLTMLTLLGAALLPVSSGGARTAGGGASGSFELVGHEPLGMRGMNAAPAIHGDYVYIGSRTDGKPASLNLNGAGVLVVDITDPSAPEVVNEIGPPNEGNEGETSRELRIWPEEELLVVMNLGPQCSPIIHECSPRSAGNTLRFYDIKGKKGAAPELVAEYVPSALPHEMFLWQDPKRSGRALVFMSAVSGPNDLLIVDISKARKGKVEEIATWTAPPQITDILHSLSVSNDGRRAFLAHLTDGFLIVDTSDVAKGKKKPKIRVVSNVDERPMWPGPGIHSAVKLYGRDYVLATDEVYGDLLMPPLAAEAHGCPWGWVRILDISNPRAPEVVAEYKLPQNEEDFCATDPPRPSSSYSAHNPTLTKNLAFVTWHAGGLQAISLANPEKPTQVAEFVPEPLPVVLQEDPALSLAQDKVVTWSYPIIQDGLIYFVDVRNGLYILRYDGPFAEEVAKIRFIEGNSNLGDALRFEKPKGGHR